MVRAFVGNTKGVIEKEPDSQSDVSQKRKILRGRWVFAPTVVLVVLAFVSWVALARVRSQAGAFGTTESSRESIAVALRATTIYASELSVICAGVAGALLCRGWRRQIASVAICIFATMGVLLALAFSNAVVRGDVEVRYFLPDVSVADPSPRFTI